MQQLRLNSTLQGGKYIIKKVLGQGGFGITYLAEHSLLGTKVAIKEFFMKELNNRDESTSHVSIGSAGALEQVERFRNKFVKEARNIARLNHPNIIKIHDIFEENGTAYYVMEYCENGSLSDVLKLHPMGVGEAMALKYIRQVASALQYIHSQKMNHLDVKPANIMLNSVGDAILIDFGLSKQYDVTTGNQTSTTPVGISHGYAPIEQYKQGGVSEFSPATDIYSLGATLYKLITGQTPPETQVLLEEELPTFAATPNVETAIRKAMQVRRINRPQSIKEWMSLIGEISVSNDGRTSNTSSSFKETPTHNDVFEDESTCIEKSAWQEEEERRQREFQAKAEDDTNRLVALFVKDNERSLTYYYYINGQVRVGGGSWLEDGRTLFENGRIISNKESFSRFVDNFGPDTIAVFSYKNSSDYLEYHKFNRGRLIYEPQVLMLSQIPKKMPNNIYDFSFGDSYCLAEFEDGFCDVLDYGYFDEKRVRILETNAIPIKVAVDTSISLFEGLLNHIKPMLGINDLLVINTTPFPIKVLGRTEKNVIDILTIDRNAYIPVKKSGLFKTQYSELIIKVGNEEHHITRSSLLFFKDIIVSVDIDASHHISVEFTDKESKQKVNYDLKFPTPTEAAVHGD